MFTSNMLMSNQDKPKPWTNFSEYSINQQPSDWTRLWGTAGSFEVKSGSPSVFGGKCLEQNTGGTAQARVIVWDKFPPMEDMEALALVQTASGTGAQSALTLRASGGSGNHTGYQFDLTNSVEFRLLRYLNGSASFLAFPSFSFSSNTWYWIRARAIGTTIQGRVWPYGSSEPSSWNISVTNFDISTGQIGVGGNHNTGPRLTDFFAASDGSAIPLPV